MITLRIGRDQDNSQLAIEKIEDGKIDRFVKGKVNSVPSTVSRLTPERCHVLLEFNESTLDVKFHHQGSNYTFINNQPMLNGVVKRGSDIIEIGATNNRYAVNWKMIDEVAPTYVNIRHLERIFNDYDKSVTDLQVKEKQLNNLRMGIFAVGALLSAITVANVGISVIIALLTLACCGASFLFAKTPVRIKKMKEQLEKDFVCPCCGYGFFTMGMNYRKLQQVGRCPGCKAIFKW